MKKMRRLIPAVAMLMVAAVMLSTASFAWFTMNEQVTATGMSVQAQASGSMVIDDVPLTAISNGITVDFASMGSKKLSPITYNTETATAEKPAGWITPANSNNVDLFTGAYDGTFVNQTVDSTPTGSTLDGQYVIKRTVWIGVAGDTVTKNIEVDLDCDVNVDIANAYAIAFFVNDDFDAPALILHVKDGKTATDRLLFDAPQAIPSTIGVEGTGVGIKVTMYVYVDGSYASDKTYTPKNPTYTNVNGAAYDADETYYVLKDGNYVPAPQTNSGLNAGDTITEDWFTYDLVDGTPETVYYVNNSYAPNAPSGLEVAFRLVD